MGLHRLDANWMIVQTILAVTLGYIGGVYWGMTGIFLGLLIPLVLFTLIRKGIVISKHALDMNKKQYINFISKEIVKISVSVFIAMIVCNVITIPASVLSILVKGLIALIIGITIPAFLSFKTTEFKSTMELVNRLIKK